MKPTTVSGSSPFGGVQQAGPAIARVGAARIVIDLLEIQAHPHVEDIADPRIAIYVTGAEWRR